MFYRSLWQAIASPRPRGKSVGGRCRQSKAISRRMRLELLEDRSLLSATVAPVITLTALPVTQTMDLRAARKLPGDRGRQQ